MTSFLLSELILMFAIVSIDSYQYQYQDTEIVGYDILWVYKLFSDSKPRFQNIHKRSQQKYN